MNRKATLSRYAIYSIFMLIAISNQVQANWFLELIDPKISLWDSISPGNKNLSSTDLIDITGYVGAFGDINNDKFTDLFIISKDTYSLDSDTVAIYEWGGNEVGYVQLGDILTFDQYSIVSLIPSDFNYDGKLDLLVQYTNGANYTELSLYYGDGTGNWVGSISVTPNPSNQQLLLFDANNDMRVDLFGTDEDGNRIYWINNADNTWTSTPQSTSPLDPIASPHSNAFVDITGDCLSDLVVFSESNGTKKMEVWTNTGTAYTLNQPYPLPQGAGQVSFADFDKDGTMDLVFPVCFPALTCEDVNSIYIVYNYQTPMCTSITGTGDSCTSSGNICGIQNGFSIPNMDITNSTTDVIIIPKSEFDSIFLWQYPIQKYSSIPATLRIGDFNIDGYPDIMFQVFDNATSVPRTQLWENVPCSSSTFKWCSQEAENDGRRTFQMDTSGTQNLTNIGGVFATAFLDIGEDGTLDMLVMSDSDYLKENSKRTVKAVINNVDYGNFFFKVLGLNGKCTQWCSSDPTFPDPKPVGVNMPGVVFKYIYTNNDGDKEVAMGNQLTQSAYLSLQSPYYYFGLGSVSNYIQTLYTGVSISGGKKSFGELADIIPNSQVACFPYPADSPVRWKYDILLRPSGMTFWTVVTCIFSCTVLAIFTVYFAYREKKQDREERREKAHLFKL